MIAIFIFDKNPSTEKMILSKLTGMLTGQNIVPAAQVYLSTKWDAVCWNKIESCIVFVHPVNDTDGNGNPDWWKEKFQSKQLGNYFVVFYSSDPTQRYDAPRCYPRQLSIDEAKKISFSDFAAFVEAAQSTRGTYSAEPVGKPFPANTLATYLCQVALGENGVPDDLRNGKDKDQNLMVLESYFAH